MSGTHSPDCAVNHKRRKRGNCLCWMIGTPMTMKLDQKQVSCRQTRTVEGAGFDTQGCIFARASFVSSPQTPSRRTFLLFSCTASAALATELLLPKGVNAVCGEPDPYFAHYLDWAEGRATGPGGRSVHYRVIGSRKKENKGGKFPVIYIGDAGVAMASGETFELLGESGRRVVFADLLGVGESDSLTGEGLNLNRADVINLALEEVLAVLRALGISENKTKEPQALHVIASGFGLEVADALIQATDDSDLSKKINLRITSAAAEGWTPVTAEQGGDMTFAALQGTRICAVEGAEAGDISIVRKLYPLSMGSDKTPMVSAIERISKRVPTLALRTFDTRPLDASAMGSGLFTERVLSQAGRIAHLAGSEDTLKAVDDFFSQFETLEEKA